MKHVYHVVTPLARFENLTDLVKMLYVHQVQWHPIIDLETPFRLQFDQPWIHPVACPTVGKTFYARCNMAMNWFLSYVPMQPDHRYCFLNDDDAYEPGFFDKVSAHTGDLVICSMVRGNNTPPGVTPEHAHGTSPLIACPGNVGPGKIGLEQAITVGSVLWQYRFPLTIMGDGEMITKMAADHPPEFAPEANVWFNYYEKGRWNK